MKQKILVVDDAQEILDLMQAMLEGQGYEVVTANNGLTGLQKAKFEKPQLVIADVLMPEMDGYLFFKELRKDPATQNIPVFILTARAKMEDSFRAIGVDGFLSKPLDVNKLLAEVAREMSVFIKEKDHIREKSPAPQMMDELARPEPPASGPVPTSAAPRKPGGKSVLVFGYESSVLKEMAEQLEGKQYAVTVVDHPEQVEERVLAVDPAVVLLEVKSGAPVPLNEVLATIHSALRKNDGTRIVARATADILIYKVHHAISGVSTVASDVADTDNILEQCSAMGYTKYIGLYSPFTFYLKIKSYLRK